MCILSVGSIVWYGLGVLFFCLYEDWAPIDSWCPTTVTITSAGYGAIAPPNQPNRTVAVFYILASVSLIAFALAHHTAHILPKLEPLMAQSGEGTPSKPPPVL